jgi:hypothetical protein
MSALLRRLLEHRLACLALVLAHVALVWGLPVPDQNEEHYLVPLLRVAEPSVLAGDWTFGTALPDRWTFDTLFGLLARLVPLTALAWAGRVAGWVLSGLALLRVGERLGIRRALVAVALSLWVVWGQSLVGGEWLLGWMEAKAAAWVCLLWALEGALAGRLTRTALLAGLAVTWHPAVGLVGAASLVVGLLVARTPWRALWKPSLVGLACALPGLIQAVAMTLGAEPSSADDWRFLSLTFMQIHLNFMSFSISGGLGTLAAAWLVLAWAGAAWDRPERRLALGLLLLPLALALLGVTAHLAGWWRVMGLMPYRLFPALALLLGCLAAAALLSEALQTRARPRLMLLLALVLVALTSAPAAYRQHAHHLLDGWVQPPDELRQAFEWVREHLPPEQVGLVPPWRGDAALTSRHAQVVHFAMPRYDKLSEWRRRAETLGGAAADAGPGDGGRDPGRAWTRAMQAFRGLTPGRLCSVAAEFHASFLVSDVPQPFPALHRVGHAAVYAIDRQACAKKTQAQ